MNYFDKKDAAEIYSKWRPYFHNIIVARIRNYLQLDIKLENALDVACGTGLSSVSLLDIADNVFGTDTSEEMLNRAILQNKIHYSLAPAENQPFPDKEFNLITVCSGVHWFNIDGFLLEANRLLRNNSWLVLYDNFFISEMQELDSFSKWYPDVFLQKFPAPKRNNNYDWSNENLISKKFTLHKVEEFKNPVIFTKDELVFYLTTQSNITAMIESGQMTYSDVEEWLQNELKQFFLNGNSRTINFGNWIKYLQKID